MKNGKLLLFTAVSWFFTLHGQTADERKEISNQSNKTLIYYCNIDLILNNPNAICDYHDF